MKTKQRTQSKELVSAKEVAKKQQSYQFSVAKCNMIEEVMESLAYEKAPLDSKICFQLSARDLTAQAKEEKQAFFKIKSEHFKKFGREYWEILEQ